MKKDKKVLITGGSGFIGRHAAELLKEKGYMVAILDRTVKKPIAGVRVFEGDIRDEKIVNKAMNGMDYVYHLAGLLGTEELLFHTIEAADVNIIGSLRIMEAAVKNKTKLLLVSKPNPWLNTYSITKETSEKFCMMFQKEFALKAAIVKWFSVYGPGQKHYGVQKAVPTFIMKALKNENIPIFDTGRQTADFIYTSDAIQATVLVAESKKAQGEIVEIGTGKETKVEDLAKMIIGMTGSKSKIVHLPMRKGEDKGAHVVADTTKLKKLTHFKPKIDLETGIRETIAYYKTIVGI
jgi:UDP-glucose 4-epimerase